MLVKEYEEHRKRQGKAAGLSSCGPPYSWMTSFPVEHGSTEQNIDS